MTSYGASYKEFLEAAITPGLEKYQKRYNGRPKPEQVLKSDADIIENIYKGMRKICNKYGIEIIGGNITHGMQLIIDISMIGEALKENLKFRSNAKPGDVIMVSGDLGSSTAGLNLFLKNIDGFSEVKKKHTEPEAKFYKVKPFLKYIYSLLSPAPVKQLYNTDHIRMKSP